MIRLALPAICGLALAGCLTLGGDMIIRVSGSVPAQESSATCRLEAVSVQTGKTVSTRDVPAEFSTTMMVVVGPEAKPYYFAAACGDRRFRSRDVMIGSRKSSRGPFDLGTLAETAP